MLHIYPMCGVFHLSSIDTGTRGLQFNISAKRHQAGILLMKVLYQGIEPMTNSTAGDRLNH